MKQILLVLCFFAFFLCLTYAWPTQVGGCGSPLFFDSFNGSANQHTSEFPSNGSWVLTGIPSTWYPNSQYVITINGTNAGVNNTKNSRVRGFLVAAYDSKGIAQGQWSDSLGYAQTKTCGEDGVVTHPNPLLGTPGFALQAGTVGSHTGTIGNTVKVYQLLSVVWTSPPVAVPLQFSGVIVSDKIYNSLLPVYNTTGIQGTSPIPTITTQPTTQATTQPTSNNGASTQQGSSQGASTQPGGTTAAVPGSASSITVSFFLVALFLATLL